MTQQRDLLEPFGPKAIKQIKAGKYTADFVSWTDKLQRILQLELGYDWKIITPSFPSGDADEPIACHGRLKVVVDGELRVSDGIGQGKDAKTASTDAFARACGWRGLGLHLWCQGGDKDGGFWILRVLDES